MGPTTAFWLGVMVGGLGLIIFVKLVCLVDDRIQRRVERKLRKQAEERFERMKQMIMDEAIQQLEDHANWEDDE